MNHQRLAGLCLITFIALMYFSFPTRNHYWDGIGFALAIEDSPGLTYRLFNQNHLFYNFFGYLIYHPIHWLVPHFRALTLLSALSTVLSVSSAYLLFSMLATLLRDGYYSVCLTLLFAFSATWWKFSTDANAYVPSVFFLLLAAYKLKSEERPNWFAPCHKYVAAPDCGVLFPRRSGGYLSRSIPAGSEGSPARCADLYGGRGFCGCPLVRLGLALGLERKRCSRIHHLGPLEWQGGVFIHIVYP